jgi:hypothetical protein
MEMAFPEGDLEVLEVLHALYNVGWPNMIRILLIACVILFGVWFVGIPVIDGNLLLRMSGRGTDEGDSLWR